MNWKTWGCVALLGLMNIAQGIEFKDAPTIQSILEQYGKDKTDFKLVHVKPGVYQWLYTDKGQKISGGLENRVGQYKEFMEPGFAFKPIPMPKNLDKMTKEQFQAYMEKATAPTPPIGFYIQGFKSLAFSSKDIALSKQALLELSGIILKKCHGLDSQQVQQISRWIKEQKVQPISEDWPQKTFGRASLITGESRIPNTDLYASILTINRSEFGGTPNRDGWNQFCRDQD